MNCSTNTMLKVAAAIGALLGIAYFAFPAAQTMLLASGPYLLLLICPISMGVMMLMMKGTGDSMSNNKTCNAPGTGHKTTEPQPIASGKF